MFIVIVQNYGCEYQCAQLIWIIWSLPFFGCGVLECGIINF